MKTRRTLIKSLKGVVSQTSSHKTVRVVVFDKIYNKKLKKSLTVTKKFLVHDEKGEKNINDLVSIRPGRKVSKQKSWHIVND